MIKSRENPEKPYFWAILGPFWPKFAPKNFFGKIGFHHIWESMITHQCAKNQKKLMIKSRENPEKPYFWAILGPFYPKFAKNFFFLKIGLRHIWGFMVTHLCAKNQKKLMNQSWENLITDERTNGRTNTGQFIGPPGRSKKPISDLKHRRRRGSRRRSEAKMSLLRMLN